jgi:putative hydrolase of the HAD superfamily
VVKATEAFANEFMHYVRLDADAHGILQKLHGKYRLGMVSNFAIPECVSTLLEKFGLEAFFDTVVVSGNINRRKPSPEIFQKALRELGVNPSEAVFVGDTLGMDIKGAKAVGMNAILIVRETSTPDMPKLLVWQPPKDDITLEPDKIVRSLTELFDIIEDC